MPPECVQGAYGRGDRRETRGASQTVDSGGERGEGQQCHEIEGIARSVHLACFPGGGTGPAASWTARITVVWCGVHAMKLVSSHRIGPGIRLLGRYLCAGEDVGARSRVFPFPGNSAYAGRRVLTYGTAAAHPSLRPRLPIASCRPSRSGHRRRA